MHITAQEEYGLRCLLQVASRDGGPPVSGHEIATAEGLTPEYVAKLMRVLRQGGLVSSTRGAAGGYTLTSPADQVTVWDAVSVLGGSVFSDNFCASHSGALSDCAHSTDCSVRGIWQSVSGLLRFSLSRLTLAQLANGEAAATTELTSCAMVASGGAPADCGCKIAG